MPIDPIAGVASGLVGAASTVNKNKKYDDNMKRMSKRHSKACLNGELYLYEQALQRAGKDVPLGWMYTSYIGSMKNYFSKEEYLHAITYGGRSMLYDADFWGWNKEWGDCKTECAKAMRAYQAAQNPKQKKQIMATPLEEFYFEVEHWETPAERYEREKKEEK